MMDRIEKLMQSPKVQAAFDQILKDRDLTLEQQLELVQIPSPSNQEEKRSRRFAEMLEEIGLGPVTIDEVNNVYVTIKGSKGTPKVLMTGHCDTVFPMGTDLTVRYKEDGKICAPGICDDTRALAEVLEVARAIKKAGIQPVGDLILGCDVGEESIGDLRGVRHYCATMPDLDGFISIDGPQMGALIYGGTGGHKYKVTFSGLGGHSFVAFGVPNPAHAMGRAISMLADLEVPKTPKTTFNVGLVSGGTSVNAIPAEVSFSVDLRSNDPGELERLDASFRNILQKAVDTENARWTNEHKITYEIHVLSDRPAGRQPEDAPIVLASKKVLELMDIDYVAFQEGCGSTDSNWPIHMGIPSITLGRGGIGGLGHTVNEWFIPKDEYKGPQKDLLTALALTGMEGTTEPILTKRK